MERILGYIPAVRCTALSIAGVTSSGGAPKIWLGIDVGLQADSGLAVVRVAAAHSFPLSYPKETGRRGGLDNIEAQQFWSYLFQTFAVVNAHSYPRSQPTRRLS